VIITTGRIGRTLVNKINLLVDSPRSIDASRLAPVKAESIFLRCASGCFGTSRGSLSTTSTTLRVRVPWHVARLVTRLVVDYFAYAARPVAWHVARLITRLGVDYFTYAARPIASARRVACRVTRRRLLRLRRASGCLGMSRGSSRGSSHRSSSTTPPRAGSSLTTSPTPRVWVPRHVAQLIVWLVVDYFSSRRLERRASDFLGTLRGSSRSSPLTTSTTPRARVPQHVARLAAPLVIDYFAYATRPGASARRAARHAARRRLLRLRRASGWLGMSCGLSPGSSSTTSPMPRVRLLWHVARLVA
jgi:hypothetical protein